MARALQLGRSEAAAVNNLVHKVAPEAVTFLENSVKRRGMLKYMSHDVIGKDLLNEGYTRWASWSRGKMNYATTAGRSW